MRALAICLLLCFSVQVSGKQIAFTFDDAPRRDSDLSGAERARLLLAGLREAGVSQAAFFVNTAGMQGEGRLRVESYAKAGHLLGNHTHAHPNFNETSLDEYVKGVRRAHDVLSKMPGFFPFFRFPFLREGNTLEKRDGLRAELARLGLKNAYVTVNTYDWHMDTLYQQARRANKVVDLERLKRTYVDVLMSGVSDFDQMAGKVLGRSPKHVLLLHENDLAALYIKDLAAALKKAGWSFISPSEAFTDEIAAYAAKEPLKFNPGRIGEIAKDKGWPSSKLWPETCNEVFLEQLFTKNRVFSDRL